MLYAIRCGMRASCFAQARACTGLRVLAGSVRLRKRCIAKGALNTNIINVRAHPFQRITFKALLIYYLPAAELRIFAHDRLGFFCFLVLCYLLRHHTESHDTFAEFHTARSRACIRLGLRERRRSLAGACSHRHCALLIHIKCSMVFLNPFFGRNARAQCRFVCSAESHIYYRSTALCRSRCVSFTRP